jgi:hypothetical protein
LDVFRSLVNSPGWGKLVELAKSQISIRDVASLQPAKGVEDLFLKEGLIHEKGGIKLFMGLPGGYVELLTEQRDALLAQIRADEEELKDE